MTPTTGGRPHAPPRLAPGVFEALFEQSLDPALIVRTDGAILRANAAAARALGRSQEELVGRGRRDIAVEDEALRSLVSVRAMTGSVRAEVTLLRADGSTFPAAVTSAVIQGGGEPIAHVTFRDLTTEREAARALLESEQRFAAVFDRSPVAMALSRLPETTYVAVNDAWRALFEVGDVDVAGKTGVDLGIATQEDWDRVGAAVAREGSLRNREVVRRTRSGHERLLLLGMEPLSIGGQRHLISIAVDVTEDRQRRAGGREAP